MGGMMGGSKSHSKSHSAGMMGGSKSHSKSHSAGMMGGMKSHSKSHSAGMMGGKMAAGMMGGSKSHSHSHSAKIAARRVGWAKYAWRWTWAMKDQCAAGKGVTIMDTDGDDEYSMEEIKAKFMGEPIIFNDKFASEAAATMFKQIHSTPIATQLGRGAKQTDP